MGTFITARLSNLPRSRWLVERKSKMSVCIGIDLGTTNSEVAVVDDGQPQVVPVEGNSVMPSCVGLDAKGNLIVGAAAKNQMIVRPDATILSIKRKMGESCKVDLGGQMLTPEEISALILKKLKHAAEKYLGEKVERAVITVPAYFDDAQRKATRNAGILAGLDVARIINEPTAAALAYDANLETDETVLVYDLGGGTFDVSLVIVENGVVEVKASHGNTHLGGDDFDNLLMENVAGRFQEQYDINLMDDKATRNRLWSAVESGKQQLSDAPYAQIREEFIHGDRHLDLEISRLEYENMIRPLVQKTMDSVHQCLKDSAMLPGAVDRVILVGGTSRTPLVKEMIQNAFRIESRHEINPDLIVAMGAAIQAGAISGKKTRSILVDITPYTFGTSAVSMHEGDFRPDVFVPIIHRNIPLPVEKSEVFDTMIDAQEAVDVRIYQGEAPIIDENTFIGNFLIEGLSDVPAGNQIVLTLSLDLSGILQVTAVEKRTGLSKSVRMEIDPDKKAFNLDQAQKNLNEFINEGVAHYDEKPGGANTKPDLLSRAKRLRKRVLDIVDHVDETDREELRTLVDKSKKAVTSGDDAALAELNESLSDMLFYLED